MRRRVFNLITVLFGVFGLMIWLRYTLGYTTQPSDFTQDYIAAYAMRTGEPIYGESIARLSTKLLGFRADENVHPPIIAVGLIPLSYLPYRFAVIIWNVINLMAFVVLIRTIVIELKLALGFCRQVHFFLLVWYPFISNTALVQSSLLVALAMILAWKYLRLGREGPGGLLLGIAALIKIYPVFFLLPLFAMKRWRDLLIMSAVGLVALASVLAALGAEPIRLFAQGKIGENLANFTASPLNSSIPGLVSQLFAENEWNEPIYDLSGYPAVTCLAILVLISAFVKSGWPFRSGMRDAKFDDYFALGILTMLLVSPLTWTHALPLLLLPIGILMRNGYRDLPSVRIGILAIVLTGIPDIWVADWMVMNWAPAKFGWGIAVATKFSLFAIILLWVTFYFRVKTQRGSEPLKLA